MADAIIKVENVSKKFCKSLKKSMLYGIADISKNLIGRATGSNKLRKREFWAVDNVSFELKKGETLGMIGPNGSGKSTLLKMLNGIFWPDKGKITISGRVGALIEVGAGFHPMLTGRENIYVNGAILGMSKNEIDSKYNEIVAFADIGDFLDTPVKNYSSGMFVRLGFAIAIHSDPDILLIDEVLAVGDLSFRRKCYNKIDELKNKCAIILVSHDMFQIGRVCSKVLFIDEGILQYYGSVSSGISKYYEKIDLNNSITKEDLSVEGQIRIKGFNYSLKNNNLKINLSIEKDKEFKDTSYILSISFSDGTDLLFAQANSLFNGVVFSNCDEITCEIPKLNLNNGRYFVNIVIFDEKHSFYYSMYKKFFILDIKKEFIANANVHYDNAIWTEQK